MTNGDGPSLDLLTERVIGCAFNVSNTVGAGFLEKIYENALAIELTEAGIEVEQQRAIQVRYKTRVIGEFFADLCVDDHLIVELKCAQSLGDSHNAQCLNYLKATGFKRALLLNFQHPKVEIKRVSL